MTPETVDVIQRSFALVACHKVTAGHVFYEHLFTVAPDLRSMFKGDLTSQAKKLVDTIGLCVAQLSYPEMVGFTLQGLGERHVAYGVKAEHYAIVGETLLWTLKRMLGPSFSPEVETAWVKLYDAATSAMIEPLASSSGPPSHRQSAA